MTLAQLKEICLTNSLSQSGLKKTVLARVIQALEPPQYDFQAIESQSKKLQEQIEKKMTAQDKKISEATKAASTAATSANIAAKAAQNATSSATPAGSSADHEWTKKLLESRIAKGDQIVDKLFSLIQCQPPYHNSNLISSSRPGHMHVQPPTSVADPVCEECEKKPPSLICDKCGMFYCGDCSDRVHSKGSLKDHCPRSVMCEECNKAAASLSCVDCELRYCTCQSCSVDRHRKGNFREHKLVPV